VAIIEGFNHCEVSRLEAKGNGAKAIRRSHCSGNEEDKLEQLKKERYHPVEKYPYLLLSFYDTYTYYLYLESISFLYW
jgi:hypothetical protein